MKDVWILNHYAVEPGGSGGTRHFHLAQHLKEFGWNASIIAASVELTTGRQRLEIWQNKQVARFEGVQFLWIRTPNRRGNGLGRMANMLAYTFRVLLPSYTEGLERPDVIIGSSVHPFAALSGALLARRYKVPFVFEVRDLWPQTLIDLGKLRPGSLVVRAMTWLERWLYRRAKFIVVLLPRAVDYIAPLGIPENRVVWIPNGVELSRFPDPGPPSQTEGRSFTLMYFGAHGQANSLDVLIKAMALIRSRVSVGRVLLRMIGNGLYKENLRKLAEASELDERWIRFEDSVEKSQIPSLAREADAFVITVGDKPDLYRFGISPNKLFDYLAANRPIVVSSGAVNDPVSDAQAGITVPPEDVGALADAIMQVVEMPFAERCQMGARGRRHVEERYGYRYLSGRLASVLDESVEKVRQ